MTKRVVKFAINQSEWCNPDNFVQMYDNIYKELLDAGVAKKFEGNGKWLNKEGNEVEKEKEFGQNANTT